MGQECHRSKTKDYNTHSKWQPYQLNLNKSDASDLAEAFHLFFDASSIADDHSDHGLDDFSGELYFFSFINDSL